MARLLNGLELQGFIQERQAKQVRNLRQEHGIVPKLCIIVSDTASPVIHTYMRMKQRYASEIQIDVEIREVPFGDIPAAIHAANDDDNVQGVILQLPIDDPSKTDEYCNLISANKDVDGLGANGLYPSATAQAIDWLLAGYNVSLEGKHIAIVGNGKLVGNPLGKLWKQQGFAVTILDINSDNIESVLKSSDVIVAAAGVPRLVTSEQIKSGAVVVDAGTTSENGVIVGDVEESVRERKDVTITPIKGGVGPLTYTVLFDHLIEACLRKAGKL